MQLYLHKPVGVKPLYCKPMVDLSLELHIAPEQLLARMNQNLGGVQPQPQATDACRAAATQHDRLQQQRRVL